MLTKEAENAFNKLDEENKETVSRYLSKFKRDFGGKENAVNVIETNKAFVFVHERIHDVETTSDGYTYEPNFDAYVTIMK
jgi:hypothetical protein